MGSALSVCSVGAWRGVAWCVDFFELTKEGNADWAGWELGSEAAKTYWCWCWPGGAAWIHGMGVMFISGLGGFGLIVWVEAFSARVGASADVGWPGGVAWIHGLDVFFH